MAALSERERYLFDLQGFVVRRGALKPKQVDALNRAVDALAPAAARPRRSRASGSPATSRTTRRFRDLLDHPAVLDVVVELCGPCVRLDHTYGIVMAPGTGGLGLHGGGTPFDPGAVLRRRGRSPAHAASSPRCGRLVDSRPGEGGFALRPRQPQGVVPDARDARPAPATWSLEVPLGAGDVVIFTEALTHGTLAVAGAASSGGSLAYKYSPGSSIVGQGRGAARPSWRPLLTAAPAAALRAALRGLPPPDRAADGQASARRAGRRGRSRRCRPRGSRPPAPRRVGRSERGDRARPGR